MAAAETASQSVYNGIEEQSDPLPTPTISTWQTPEHAPHPLADEILRQVEFYFSDDNLRQDAHLLGLIKEGKGSVSIREILSFKKMRRFKPMTAVREVLRGSDVVEVTSCNKRIRRRQPLAKTMTVIPKINENRKKNVVPEDKPWLTKGMLRPTGFEEYATDGPVRPEEYEKDREDYDPEISFLRRIETAIARFTARRKMHQNTKFIFDKFMIYGGIDSGQQQFTAWVGKEEKEELTAKEMAERTSTYGVSELVVEGINDNEETGKAATWHVDFEAIAKGFFSSQFMNLSIWTDEKQVRTATNVLRNFYNYLLLHDVCPEYGDQILAARKVCDVAEVELLKLAQVDARLPGGFNIACSTLFGGVSAGLHAPEGHWVKEDDDLGFSVDDAKKVFLAGIAAHGTEEQLAMVEEVTAKGESFKTSIQDKMGLEVVRIELPNPEAQKIYTDPKLTNTFIRPMGKLYCKRWQVPHAPPMDLPHWFIEAQKKSQNFEFLIEEATLQFCYPGLKIEAEVKGLLDVGVRWIDYFEATYPSFFTWLVNERIREWREPGPPKGYMLRSMGMEEDGAGEGDVVRYEGESDENYPD